MCSQRKVTMVDERAPTSTAASASETEAAETSSSHPLPQPPQPQPPPSLKLSVFPPDFSPAELLLRQEDFPTLRVGDVLQLHQPPERDDGTCHQPKLLLQVFSVVLSVFDASFFFGLLLL